MRLRPLEAVQEGASPPIARNSPAEGGRTRASSALAQFLEIRSGTVTTGVCVFSSATMLYTCTTTTDEHAQHTFYSRYALRGACVPATILHEC